MRRKSRARGRVLAAIRTYVMRSAERAFWRGSHPGLSVHTSAFGGRGARASFRRHCKTMPMTSQPAGQRGSSRADPVLFAAPLMRDGFWGKDSPVWSPGLTGFASPRAVQGESPGWATCYSGGRLPCRRGRYGPGWATPVAISLIARVLPYRHRGRESGLPCCIGPRDLQRLWSPFSTRSHPSDIA
jgi:hypothetical protein